MKTQVCLTIDVETSMGGSWDSPAMHPLPAERRIFCKIKGNDQCLGWQCNELNKRGLRATFFCEVLSSLVLGENDTKSYIDFILYHDQDVQLHIHPNFYHYNKYINAIENGKIFDKSIVSDRLSSFSKTDQFLLLHEACNIFKKLTGKAALAFRAGSYCANFDTLAILKNLGIQIDSSFNPCYYGKGSFDGELVQINMMQLIEDVWEIPITVAIENLKFLPGYSLYKPLEISSISLGEMIRAIDDLQAAGASHIVLVFHNFSTVKSKDLQYTKIWANKIVQRRFLGLLDYLVSESDRFTVSTMSDLASSLDNLKLFEGQHYVPRLGTMRSMIRKVTQVVNRAYWI